MLESNKGRLCAPDASGRPVWIGGTTVKPVGFCFGFAVTTALVPCLTFGQIAEVVDDGNTTCATSGLLYGLVAAFSGMPCLVSCAYRTKIRNMYGLVEAPASDWLTHLFCEPCALCQEHKELQRRGLDPSRGWQGNAAASGMNVRSHMTPPVINHRMN
ncbi:hypothetical protein ACLB2K_028890 [Fragaria x ananassa]